MNGQQFRWACAGFASLLGLVAAPAFADDDYDDWDDDDLTFRYYSDDADGYHAYNYGYPQYRTYGDLDRGDYTTPEHAWWNDYEAMHQQQRARTWQDQAYGYSDESPQTDAYYREEPFPSRPRSSQNGYDQPGFVRLRGTVIELRQVRTSRWSEPQALAIVDSHYHGRQRVVLGPVRDIRDMDLRVGDTIFVSGTYQSISGRTDLVADRFDVTDTRWTQRRVVPQGRWYHGEVKDDDHEDVNGVDHLLSRVELDDGETVQVDLGPTDLLPDIDLDDGDDIAVYGRFGSLDGETTLFADRFRWDGRSFTLDRGRGNLQLEIHAYR